MQIITLAHDTEKGSTDSFVGVYIDEDMSKKLTLLSIARGRSKSGVLRGILTRLLSTKDLTLLVAQKLYSLFKQKGKPWSKFPPKMFAVYARNELTVKGVQHFTLEEIFKKFHELVENNN